MGFDNPKATEIFGPGEVPSWDNSPGGGRNTLADIDDSKPRAKCGFTSIKLGDIRAPYRTHSFVPTISALDISTDDLFFPAMMDSTTLPLTPFEDIFIPETNEEHAQITAKNVVWILKKLDQILISGKTYASGTAKTIFAPIAIEIQNSTVKRSANLTLHAGAEIRLSGEFQAMSGSEFQAKVE